MTSNYAPTYNPKSGNYNYKSRKSFGKRIKNFFHTDIDEDLQEEKSTKIFERVKLFTINRYSLFALIALFNIITNVLVGFDLNFLYLRQILGFLFLILVPGLLLMLIFKIRKIDFWEYLVYTIGLSISFIMFAGLAVNWILPWLHITDQPLSLLPILISFDVILLVLWLIAYKRNKDLTLHSIFIFNEYKKDPSSKFKYTPKFPAFSWIDRIFLVIPFFFPFMAVIGAFLLNNRGTNIITMIMIGAIAVYVLLIMLLRDKLNENISPVALYLISLGLLLSFSLRSWYLSGWDINQEVKVANIVLSNNIWSMDLFQNAYNACLSLSILAPILKLFLNININSVFRLIIQIIFSILPVILYALYKKIMNLKILIFFACFFFIFQRWFIQQMPSLARQEIAFIFFGLMLLVLFSKQINTTFKKILFVVFGASMIVSHYSTSYLALVLFTLTYIFTFFYKKLEKNEIKRGKIKADGKKEVHLTGILIISLLIFGFIWYSQVANTATTLIDFTGKSISNIGELFNKDLFSFSIQQLLFNSNVNSFENIKNYTQEVEFDYPKDPSLDYYSQESYKTYYPVPVSAQAIKPLFWANSTIISSIFTLLKFFFNYFLILLGIGLMFLIVRKNKISIELFFMVILSLLFLSLLIFLPFASSNYDLSRVYLQLLIFLAVPCSLALIFISRIPKTKYFVIFPILLLLLYFLFYSNFIFQIFGGPAAIFLNNYGGDYDSSYTHKTEVMSSEWLLENHKFGESIFADKFARLKLFLFSNNESINLVILPGLISKNSYVYLSETNKLIGKTFVSFKGEAFSLSYNFPKEFMNDNKNKIYNNGGSEIFK